MKSEELKASLEKFSQWKAKYCKGYEKGEAQSFLDRFFQAFGYEGVMSAGGNFEEPQKRGSSKGNTGFKDCIFKDLALIEMKKGGSDLTHHYNQLLTYWVQCTPKPKYAILCNFDEFWIYDFNIQVDTPIQKIKTEEISNQADALLFMLGKTPRFNVNVVEVTKEAVKKVSELYQRLKKRSKILGISEDDARRFVLQCVLCLFAEDIGLLPSSFFLDILQNECKPDPRKSYDILRGLFEQMNNPVSAKGGIYKDVRYFNGGLFSKIVPIELTENDIEILIEASKQNWKIVRPSIFGTILESTMDQEERHAHGVHYTSEQDIYKIVRPTIVRYWDERIEEAGENSKKLKNLWGELRDFRILDPACGSGNFLYIAYKELKRIEKEIIDKIAALEKGQLLRGMVNPSQFYGIDIKPFAVELAKLTLEIGRTTAIKELDLTNEDPLPLDNLDKNIICADALFTDWDELCSPAVIIGNPPFLGSRKLRDSGFTNEYIEKIHALYSASEFPKSADFCSYWFRKAQDSSARRCGLVGSNSISQGQSRKASLEYICENEGIIHDAVSTQEWSGEAAVHVSIVNWVKNKTQTIKQCYLDEKPVPFINSSLKSETDVTSIHRLKQNEGICFQGVVPVGKGFIIPETLAKEWISKNEKNQTVLKLFSSGENLTDYHDLKPIRWIVDFNDMSLEEASNCKLPFEHVKTYVKPERDKIRDQRSKEYWWRFGRTRGEMRRAIERLDRWIAIPRVSKWIISVFQEPDCLLGDAGWVVASDDYYILGVLNSKLHRDWVKVQCSTLEDRTRYTNTTCFETFPFLWREASPPAPLLKERGVKKADKVAEIMKELDEFRLQMMKERNYGITKLYNEFFNEPASKLSKLHRQLDEAVCDVYDWKYDPNKNYNEELFKLNQEIATLEGKG